jgi:hypothetical protein
MATRKSTTTAVAVKKPSNVIAIQESLKNMAASLAERIQPGGGNKIRLSKDKQFVLPDGTKTAGPLELVIVDFVATNSFYAGKFDAKNPAPPSCFAVGTNIRAMVPVKGIAGDSERQLRRVPDERVGQRWLRQGLQERPPAGSVAARRRRRHAAVAARRESDGTQGI